MAPEKRPCEVVHERFDDFCRLCSLHGLIYLRADVKLPVCDRVFWMTIFVSSVVVSCAVIHNVWLDWTHNPIVIVYDSDVRPIWDIPFPSVTVCSLVPVKRSALDLATSNDRFVVAGTVGGLLGLFMGFSCISLVEVAYHVLLRPLGCLAVSHRKTPLSPDSPAHHHHHHRRFIKTYYAD